MSLTAQQWRVAEASLFPPTSLSAGNRETERDCIVISHFSVPILIYTHTLHIPSQVLPSADCKSRLPRSRLSAKVAAERLYVPPWFPSRLLILGMEEHDEAPQK